MEIPESEKTTKIDTISNKIKNVLDYFQLHTEKYNRSSSNVLLGITCGSTAILIAYGASLYYSPINFFIVSPFSFGIGAALSIYIARDKKRSVIEEKLELKKINISLLQIESDNILNQIKNLPKNAPPELEKRLWEKYSKLLDDPT
jgi:hypothetical protein